MMAAAVAKGNVSCRWSTRVPNLSMTFIWISQSAFMLCVGKKWGRKSGSPAYFVTEEPISYLLETTSLL